MPLVAEARAMAELMDLIDLLGTTIPVPIWVIGLAGLLLGWLAIPRSRKAAEADVDNSGDWYEP